MLIDLLNNTCDVYSLTTTQTPMGSLKKTYTLRIDDMKCAFSMRAGGEVVRFGKATENYNYVFYCEYNTTNSAIEETDKITYDGRDFEVKSIYNASGRNNHLEILAEELK